MLSCYQISLEILIASYFSHRLTQFVHRGFIASGRGAPISPEKQLAMALTKWASGLILRTVAELYCVGVTTVHNTCNTIARSIDKRLRHRVMRCVSFDHVNLLFSFEYSLRVNS